MEEERMSFISATIAQYWHSASPITFAPLNVFMDFYRSTVPGWPSMWFYCFLTGIILAILLAMLEYDQHNISNEAERFNILLIICTLSLFVFGLRAQTYELRWMFAFLPAMLAFTAQGMLAIADFVRRKKKIIVLILVVIMFGIGMYTQLNYADLLIKNKVHSYGPVKDAGIWMKENSVPGDSIISMSTPQIAYYSERATYNYQPNATALYELILREHPKFIMLSMFEVHEEWMRQWLIENEPGLEVAYILFDDQQKTSPIVIIYMLK